MERKKASPRRDISRRAARLLRRVDHEGGGALWDCSRTASACCAAAGLAPPAGWVGWGDWAVTGGTGPGAVTAGLAGWGGSREVELWAAAGLDGGAAPDESAGTVGAGVRSGDGWREAWWNKEK